MGKAFRRHEEWTEAMHFSGIRSPGRTRGKKTPSTSRRKFQPIDKKNVFFFDAGRKIRTAERASVFFSLENGYFIATINHMSIKAILDLNHIRSGGTKCKTMHLSLLRCQQWMREGGVDENEEFRSVEWPKTSLHWSISPIGKCI